jgi:nucleoside-diphosphate kinase
MERSLAIIKPDAVKKNSFGEILAHINKAGFTILGFKMIRLTEEQAGAFYAVHKERPFYGELVKFMTSGPVVPIALAKDNAVADFRTLIGATDPAEAADGTIRKLFGASKGENAIHGSDSVENGKYEVNFFFAESELAANGRA